MKLLLDTQILLWAAAGSRRLSSAAREEIENPGAELHFSAASLWEISIKHGLGREDFVVDPHLLRRGLLDNGYVELPVASRHAVHVHSLPPLHRDPFDRMLIAQAITEGFLLLTSDGHVAQYPGPIRRV